MPNKEIHAHWEHIESKDPLYEWYKCTVCGYKMGIPYCDSEQEKLLECYHCGAIMDEKEGDEK